MTSDNGFRITPRLILGLFIVGAGILFLLRELGIYDSGEIYRYWPVILIAIGLTQVFNIYRYWPGTLIAIGLTQVSNRGRGGDFCGLRCGGGGVGAYVFPVALIGLGTWLLLNNLEIVAVEPWAFFWPLLLVLIGLSLVLGSRRSRLSETQTDGSSQASTLGSTGSRSSEPRTDGSAQVSAFCLLSGSERKVNAADFRGADLTAIMGGCSLDLTQAGMASGGAVIEVFALMGGIEIKVPRDWSVESKVLPLLGAVGDETQPEAARQGAPRLLIRGSAIMGAVEISN